MMTPNDAPLPAAPLEPTAHLQILKRVGIVLVAVGLVDIAAMIYSIANGISYASSFNVFAVMAGIFLLRGSLRAASVVRWFSAFLLGGFAAGMGALPYMQPLDLTLTQIGLDRWYALAAMGAAAFAFALLGWIIRQLGGAPILDALTAVGRPKRDLRIPAAAGVSVVVLMVIFVSFLLGGESASKAKALALRQLGPEYRYHVASLRIQKNNRGTFVSGTVTAWKDKEVRSVPVQWEER